MRLTAAWCLVVGMLEPNEWARLRHLLTTLAGVFAGEGRPGGEQAAAALLGARTRTYRRTDANGAPAALLDAACALDRFRVPLERRPRSFQFQGRALERYEPCAGPQGRRLQQQVADLPGLIPGCPGKHRRGREIAFGQCQLCLAQDNPGAEPPLFLSFGVYVPNRQDAGSVLEQTQAFRTAGFSLSRPSPHSAFR